METSNGPYTNMIFGSFLSAEIPPPTLEMADRILYVSDRSGGAGFMKCNFSGTVWENVPSMPTGLATVAYTGNYNDLINKPVIPVVTVAAPVALSMSLATAYQSHTPAKASVVTINLTSTANFSLSGGTTNQADVIMGATSAVASGTGTVVGKYTNSNTGTIAVGLNQNTSAANATTFLLPPGWYFAVRQTSGTVSIVSACDQVLG